MGPIQASLNQLSLAALGAVAGVAKGFNGDFFKPKAQKTPNPRVETKSNMGNIAKIGRNTANTNMRSYEAAAKSVYATNEVIASKARSHFDPINTRLQEVNKAVVSFTSNNKEEKK